MTTELQNPFTIPVGLTKFQVGKDLVPVNIIKNKNRFELAFPYHKPLLEEIKNFDGRKWHGNDDVPRKIWSIPDNARNRFQVAYLRRYITKFNPFEPYDRELAPLGPIVRFNKAIGADLRAYEHQHETIRAIMTRPALIVAEEMGLGKTFSDIIATEIIGLEGEWWYIAPKSVLKAIERELHIWGAKITPRLMTYEQMVKVVANWTPTQKAPQKITFDECQKLKTPTAQRSQSAKHLADSCRSDWGLKSKIVMMSGTPAPKSPADWWNLCEIACPGFIREGDIHKFRNKLGLIVQKENLIQGGTFPYLVTWRDNPEKCNKCGKFKSDPCHSNASEAVFGESLFCVFEPSVNEVERLYKRMKGLVIVKFKRDCLDLPEKRYDIIELKPSPETVRAAKLLTKTCKTTIEALTRLRELSDGFQYVDVETGEETCPRCKGNCKVTEPQEIPDTCDNCKSIREEGIKVSTNQFGRPEEVVCTSHTPQYKDEEIICPKCCGSGKIKHFDRGTKEVKSPKDDYVLSLLDEYEDIGRGVFFTGFTASVDRVVRLCHSKGWNTIRVDQGKWVAQNAKGQVINPINPATNKIDFLWMFQDALDLYEQVAYVANAGSGGLGVTLTRSPFELFYSNDFIGENRTQAEDRIHRMGMDTQRGARIIDLIHLPSDRKVLDNLKGKRNLELMSMGEISKALESLPE